jgi:protease-4
VAVRRGVALVITLIVLACLVSVSGLAIIYLLMTREPVVPSRSMLVLRLSGELAEGGPDEGFAGFLTGARRPTVRNIVENLRKAGRDPRITGVLLMPSGLQAPYWAKLQEIRDALIDFRRSGKTATAYLEYGGDREYFLATGCDRIFLVPSSPLNVSGLATYELFLRGTLDKIGAYPDMYRIGDYKTAWNQLTQKGFTPAHREMDESLNNDMYDQLVRAIADARKKTPSEVRRILDQGPFLPEDALRAGLIDDVAYDDQIDGKLRAEGRSTHRLDLDDYSRVSAASFGIGAGPRIAVLYVDGTIASGKSGYDPASGGVVGSETLIESIRRIRDDSSIRAIVVRIDSPGGSSVASDVIWRELVITRDRRRGTPLVVSMSDLAASGGYYVAAAAPTIVAEPGTLTGSIGIVGGKIVIGGTLGKLGITSDSVSNGRNAEMDSPFRPFTPGQRAKFEEQLQAFYDQFVEKVAQTRHMTAEQVDALGQGRVWTGQQAKQLGLVDALGGLDRAIALAKQAAKIPAESGVEVVTYPPRRSLYDLLWNQFGSGSRQALYLAALAGVANMRSLNLLAAPLLLFRPGEPLALMPPIQGR